MTAARPPWKERIAKLGAGALELLISPVALMVSAALVWTVVAKWVHAGSNEILTGPYAYARVVASDFLVFGALGALLAWIRTRWAPAKWATLIVAGLALLLAGLNATYLGITGEQGSWYDILDAIRRRRELRDVLADMSSPEAWLEAVVVLLVVVAIGAGMRWWVRRRQDRSELAEQQRARLRTRVFSALGAWGLLWALLPSLSSVPGRALSKNVVVLVAKTASAGRFAAHFEGWPREAWIEAAALESWEERSERPNVLVVILESTRFDHTSLAGDEALAETPFLARMAKQGLVATQMRAVLPHTTKSMFSMLCGRYPTLQKGVIEVDASAAPICLPRVLREAGYATFFGQSAFGTFEQRARLVANFGFEHFAAFEDIRGQKVGYLASEDASMVGPFADWLEDVDKGQPGRPWMAVLLTSATHHSYRLPTNVLKRARTQGRPMGSDAERYARLVEAEDRFLAQLYNVLLERGEAKETVILFVGDHGEGFGDHGVKQHDNNFFEEGLRVPFVLVGPGIEGRRIEHNASLIDVMPTLVGALGLEAWAREGAALGGHDLRSADYPVDAPKIFACYDPSRCRGFVRGASKFVEVPRDDEAFVFDLEADPQERAPQLPGEDFELDAAAMRQTVGDHRVYRWNYTLPEQREFGQWWCIEQSKCRHPQAWKIRDRYDPKTGELLEDPETPKPRDP